MIGWVLGFLVGICILLFRLIAAIFVGALYLHEHAHKKSGDIIGVGYDDLGFVRGGVYKIQWDDPTPRQLFVVNLAPALLSLLSIALFVVALHYGFNIFGVVVGLFAVAVGSHSLPSGGDCLSIITHNSWSQPLSSFLSTIIVLPLLLLHIPTLLFGGRYSLGLKLSWAGTLAYASHKLFIYGKEVIPNFL